jgi:hypothetical protein
LSGILNRLGYNIVGQTLDLAMTTTMAVKYTSLDVEIPQTGTVYLFTAPQAEE